MASCRVKRQPLVLQVTPGQLARWKSYGRLYRKDVARFLVFAAEMMARYLREVERGRSKRDPVLFRQEEKQRMEALVRAAKGALDHLPEQPGHGPRADLGAAVRSVEEFWEASGEAYGI